MDSYILEKGGWPTSLSQHDAGRSFVVSTAGGGSLFRGKEKIIPSKFATCRAHIRQDPPLHLAHVNMK